MLFLNKDEMMQTLTLPKVMDKVEEAYRIFAGGEFYMPERPVFVHKGDTVLYMPCFMGEYFSTKFLTLFPGNPAQGLPYINGLMLLNDRATGETLAVMDAGALTAIRTGAVGGCGMRAFAPVDAAAAGIIGCGTQGFYQALYAAKARPVKDIYLFDSFPKDWAAYTASLAAALDDASVRLHVTDSVEELLAKAQIVIATTTANAPVMPDDAELLRGHCFIGVGSYKPEMREFPDAIWSLIDEVWTELPYAMEESGDFTQPLSAGLLKEGQVRYIGDLLLTDQPHRHPGPGETTFFKSVGLGLLDLAVSQLIYSEALAQGLGQTVQM